VNDTNENNWNIYYCSVAVLTSEQLLEDGEVCPKHIVQFNFNFKVNINNVLN
jgi:hypothetical protein